VNIRQQAEDTGGQIHSKHSRTVEQRFHKLLKAPNRELAIQKGLALPDRYQIKSPIGL